MQLFNRIEIGLSPGEEPMAAILVFRYMWCIPRACPDGVDFIVMVLEA